MQSSAPVSAGELIANGIVALRTGDKAQARARLCEALQIDTDNDQAWLWLSGAVDTDAERRYCLERVLALNPAHQAACRGLERLPPTSGSANPLPVAPAGQAAAPATLLELIAGSVATTPSLDSRATPFEADIPHQSGSITPVVDERERILSLLGTSPVLASYASQHPAPAIQQLAPSIAQSGPEAPAPTSQGILTSQIDDQMVAFVIKRLGKHTERNEVIRELTEWRHLAWVDAERLVATIEHNYLRKIAIRQAPFFFFLSVAAIIGGAIAVIGSLIQLYAALAHPSLRTPRLLVYGTGGFFTGLAMIGGGAMGVGQIFRAVVFNR